MHTQQLDGIQSDGQGDEMEARAISLGKSMLLIEICAIHCGLLGDEPYLSW